MTQELLDQVAQVVNRDHRVVQEDQVTQELLDQVAQLVNRDHLVVQEDLETLEPLDLQVTCYVQNYDETENVAKHKMKYFQRVFLQFVNNFFQNNAILPGEQVKLMTFL